MRLGSERRSRRSKLGSKKKKQEEQAPRREANIRHSMIEWRT